MVISKNTIIFKGFRGGSNFFKGEGQLFPWRGGGGPMGNFYRNPYSL